MSINNVNNYIIFKILEYGHYGFTKNNMWKQYKKDFINFTEAIFKAYNLVAIYNL